jgi:hypothetical protein
MKSFWNFAREAPPVHLLDGRARVRKSDQRRGFLTGDSWLAVTASQCVRRNVLAVLNEDSESA